MYTQRKGHDFYSRCSIVVAAVRHHVLETLCFVVKAKVLCLGFQKRTQLEICGYVVFTTQFNLNISVCAAYFNGGLFPEPGTESSLQCQLCSKTVSITWGNSSFARTVWRFGLTACMFSYLKNLPLKIQTRV